MSQNLLQQMTQRLAQLKTDGLYKDEREIVSPQSVTIQMADGRSVINLCANNYLGLANDPDLIDAAREGLERWGFGLASVRFICGTQTVHTQLEQALSRFLGTESAILFSSCFDANGGLFEALLGEEDAVISDALNHASIIDGIRLCKAQRLRYDNNDMADLERCLIQTTNARYRLIATDGVFSMDGVIANLRAICDLAEKYDALVMVDDCHAVGVMGATGRGSFEAAGVQGRVHLISGTLGKALGGASGGYVAGPKVLIDWLRQRARPYLFSNSLSPSIAQASLAVLARLEHSDTERHQLLENSRFFRQQMSAAGFTLAGADHPIIPVMIGDAPLCQRMAQRLFERGLFAVGFSYPVVPQGQARIRTQMSASHTRAQLEQAVAIFTEVGQQLGVLNGEGDTR